MKARGRSGRNGWPEEFEGPDELGEIRGTRWKQSSTCPSRGSCMRFEKRYDEGSNSHVALWRR